MSTKKILVPIDFSEQSLIAMEQSYNLTREYGAELMLLYVIEEDSLISKFFSKQQDDEIKQQIEKRLSQLSQEVSTKTGLKVTTLVARGAVYEKIVEVAEMISAYLIIMGVDGKSSIKRRFIGSNALRVVRESTVPVITIRGKQHRNGCHTIVLPLDLTKETREKVGFAIEIAKLYSGAVIKVVSVLFTSDEFLVNRLTRQIHQVKSFIEKQGVTCTSELLHGEKGEESLADKIIAYAKQVEGDLLVIMTQQEVDFTYRFIGSSAQEIINNSEVPVISIIPRLKRDYVFNPY